jgi:hypothetical protein
MRALLRRPFLYLGIETIMMRIRILVLVEPRVAAVVRGLDLSLVNFDFAIVLLVRRGCHNLRGFEVQCT